MSTVQDLYPWVELAPPPRARPLAESVKYPLAAWEEELSRVPSFLPNPGSPSSAQPPVRKGSVASIGAKSIGGVSIGGKSVGGVSVRGQRESYDLSGTRFLRTNTGKTLKLPIPSDSSADPLNWSLWRTAGAMFAVYLYSVVALTAAQAASVVMGGIQNEFYQEVC
jgi:hypothetical protein